MIRWIKSKLALSIIGFVAFLAAIGGGGVALAHAHTSTTTNTPAPIQKEEVSHIQGVIKSIDATTLTIVLLPDGQGQAITISFDRQTNSTQENGQPVAGAHVIIEVVPRSNGMLYATEIKPVSQVNQGQNGSDERDNDNDSNDDRGNRRGGHQSGQGDDGGGHGHNQENNDH